VIQGFNDYVDSLGLIGAMDVTEIFPAPAPTCDHFLPDIFAQTCSCVGTCNIYEGDGSPSNRVYWFITEGGLDACQKACNNRDGCQFFTLSRTKSLIDVDGRDVPELHYCNMFNSCDTFYIPAGTTGYNAPDPEDPRPGPGVISDHWSGPADCTGLTTACPIQEDGITSYKRPWKKTQRMRLTLRGKGRKKARGRRKRKGSRKPKSLDIRAFGAATSVVNPTNETFARFPWLCSLKETGFTGRHRCGVTLLSGQLGTLWRG
jgi:hypothetical protein